MSVHSSPNEGNLVEESIQATTEVVEDSDNSENVDLLSLCSDLHRRILQKFDYETFCIFDQTSSVAVAISEQHGSLLYPLTTDKINFIKGLKSYTIDKANDGQAQLIANACVLPVNNPDFEENYEALLKNRSVIGLLMLRSTLKNLTLEMFDKLLKTLTIWRISLEGRMFDNYLKSKEIHKLKKMITSNVISITDEQFLEMNEKAPEEVKFERTILTQKGVADFIKQYLTLKRSAHLIHFPKTWENFDELKGCLSSHNPQSLECPLTENIVQEATKDLVYRKRPRASETEPGLSFSHGTRSVNVIVTDDNNIFIVFQ